MAGFSPDSRAVCHSPLVSHSRRELFTPNAQAKRIPQGLALESPCALISQRHYFVLLVLRPKHVSDGSPSPHLRCRQSTPSFPYPEHALASSFASLLLLMAEKNYLHVLCFPLLCLTPLLRVSYFQQVERLYNLTVLGLHNGKAAEQQNEVSICRSLSPMAFARCPGARGECGSRSRARNEVFPAWEKREGSVL